MFARKSKVHSAIMAGLFLLCACSDPSNSAESMSSLTRGEGLAASCTGCHSSKNEQTPTLRGLSAEAVAASLQAYKTDRAGNTVMHRIARGYSEADIAELASYFGRAK